MTPVSWKNLNSFRFIIMIVRPFGSDHSPQASSCLHRPFFIHLAKYLSLFRTICTCSSVILIQYFTFCRTFHTSKSTKWNIYDPLGFLHAHREETETFLFLCQVFYLFGRLWHCQVSQYLTRVVRVYHRVTSNLGQPLTTKTLKNVSKKKYWQDLKNTNIWKLEN